MKIIVGLGNPGAEYAVTRHNAGLMFVNYFADQLHSEYGWRKHYGVEVFKTPDLVLVRSHEVFMNESGRMLQGLPEGELWLVHDDLDIKLGEYKIQKGVGPKVHGGVNSVEQTLGEKDFWRIRIGIENRIMNNESRIMGEEYVLQKFSLEEKRIIDEVIVKIVGEIV
ncbi:MAG: aminoacyl-tRNA hydrolase [Patescibacteria group bacterium]